MANGDILNSKPMSLNERVQSVSDLTSAQQKVLQIVLQIPAFTFNTADIIAKSAHFSADGQAIGGVLGSLYRLGMLERLSGGRNKEWRVASHLLARKGEIGLELLTVDTKAKETTSVSKPRRMTLEELMAG